MALQIRLALLFILAFAFTGAAFAQGVPDTEKLLAAQREAMTVLDFMDGTWQGTGWIVGPTGQKSNLTQTERIGPFLDGAVKVIEGRAYGDDGKLAFNAFGIVSYDPATESYAMRSYAQGHTGDFPLTPTTDGFTWEIAAGPATIRYQATLQNGTWHEVGDRIMPGQEPFRFFEMKLERLGDSDWPAAGVIKPSEASNKTESKVEAISITGNLPGDDIVPPRPINRSTTPAYTKAARKNKVEGTIILQAVIDKEGNVGEVKILRGLPHGLNESATTAVKSWNFEPGTIHGEPMETQYNVTINMSMPDRR